MTFLNDKLWSEAKRVAKSNGLGDNWVEIMDYYYFVKGCHVMIYAIIDEEKYRILRITDSEEVLLADRNNELIVRPYDEVVNSRKQFFYNDVELKPEVHKLPEGQTIYGASVVKIYI